MVEYLIMVIHTATVYQTINDEIVKIAMLTALVTFLLLQRGIQVDIIGVIIWRCKRQMNYSNLFNVLLSATSTTDEAADAVVTATDATMSCAEAFSSSGGWTIILMYAAILGICYLLFIRPQNKRRQQEEQMRKSVEIGDEITTIGGICGRIVSIKDDETLVIETGTDRNKMKIKNWAISSNDTARERQEAAAPAEKEKKGLFGRSKKNQ